MDKEEKAADALLRGGNGTHLLAPTPWNIGLVHSPGAIRFKRGAFSKTFVRRDPPAGGAGMEREVVCVCNATAKVQVT